MRSIYSAYFISILVGIVFLAGHGCYDPSPVQPVLPGDAGIIGTWYAAGPLFDGTPDVVFACTFGENDTCVQSLVSCSREMSFLRSVYRLEGDTIVSIVVFDTSIQNALEVFFAASGEGTWRTRFDVSEGQLFLENADSGSFFESPLYGRTRPELTGAILSGALSISNPSADCFIRILASDKNSDRFYLALLDGAATFCIEGIAQGRYHVSATYFTRRDAYLMGTIPFDSLIALGFYDSLSSAGYGSEVVVTDDSLYDAIDIYLQAPKIPGDTVVSSLARTKKKETGTADRWRRLAVRQDAP